MKILVSGFKPFLGQKINPSQNLALDLEKNFDNVEALILPVEFTKSFLILQQKIQVSRPDYLIMLGQASGRKNICFEKIALNWCQSHHADENNFRPQPGHLVPESELALMTLFPIDLHYEELKALNKAVEISFLAGTYVCNDLYYRVLHSHRDLQAVFIHVPLVAEQVTEVQDYFLAYSEQLEILKLLIHRLRRN